jgi:phosphoglycerate dehydrogenase-like enzyme
MPDFISDPDVEMQVFGEQFQMITPAVSGVDDVAIEDWQCADAVMGLHTLYYDQALINQLDNCKIIIRIGVGFENVALRNPNSKIKNVKTRNSNL